jgi:hypothetical protein
VQHVVDVGGGTGTLLAEILKSRPWVRAGRWSIYREQSPWLGRSFRKRVWPTA